MGYLLFFTFLTVVIVTFFAFSSKFKQVRKKYSKGIDFYFTLLATIIGVVLALYFSDLVQNSEDKRYVINMLEISKSNVDNTIELNNSRIKFYKNIKYDSVHINSNKLIYPKHSENILFADTKIAQNISVETYNNLLKDYNGVETMRIFFHNTSHKYDDKVPKHYVLQLQYISKKMALEIEFQKKKIEKQTLLKKLNSLQKEYETKQKEIYKQ